LVVKDGHKKIVTRTPMAPRIVLDYLKSEHSYGTKTVAWEGVEKRSAARHYGEET